MSTVAEPTIIQFGPYRVIGLGYRGKNEHGEIPALWDAQAGLPARLAEIAVPAGANFAVGLCRCIPGATDGSFEYLAALPAAADAPVPPGMMEAFIPAATYAAFPVESLQVLMDRWGQASAWVAAHPEWQAYCGAAGCDCARYPSFELYPPEFTSDGTLFLYLPVRPAK